MCNIKDAIVYKDRTGYWRVVEQDTGRPIGLLQDSELAAYKLANREGYIVR